MLNYSMNIMNMAFLFHGRGSAITLCNQMKLLFRLNEIQLCLIKLYRYYKQQQVTV